MILLPNPFGSPAAPAALLPAGRKRASDELMLEPAHQGRADAAQVGARSVAVRPRIALFLPSLSGGGLERIFLHLAQAFADGGHPVDMVLTRPEGEYRAEVPAPVNLVELAPVGTWQSRLSALKGSGTAAPALVRPVLGPLRSPHMLRYLPHLADYLRRREPAALIAGPSYSNLVALMARRLAGVATRVIVTEHNTLSQTISHRR